MARLEREVYVQDQEALLHPLRLKLWERLVTTEVEKGYMPDRTRQRIIFDRIDWNTFQKEIASESKGSGVGGPARNASQRDAGGGKQLRGKIFEMLVAADPEFGTRTPLEKELLSLAHNPDAFGLGKELGYHRNPDMAFLIVQKEDGVVIEGVGESKLGLLNERSFKQLSETGFAKGVKALVDVVNNLPNPEVYGLVEVAKARLQIPEGSKLLTVSAEFSQLLVVPANRNIEWSSTLINRKEFSKEGRDKFYTLLSDTRHLRTARAAFSTKEVVAITNGC